ncbi:CoA-transferase [Nocardia sp. CDC159]|uniref:CoA-transferase n=1 Tax=Nocardia pulmonis TaxID=2951408 RepID=A0A9X2E7F3_9NOCA|nr:MULTISPECIES: CoA-transferase [Nocardia]MCM6772888.1 CoA-transferase [Nocardia pulmonis]MCM6785809.1 CoA-transferase [Nocardia sp. CDC159]
MTDTTIATRAEVCAVACAEIFRGAGEIMASPMSPIPTIGARLARLTFAPDLLISDGEAILLAEPPALGGKAPAEGWIPFGKVFDVVASGRRHVIMGANQLDRYGNQNLSAFGPLQRPTRQMFGVRGAPGNTINHPTSYFVPRHGRRVFCERVDIVSGIGYDRVDPGNPAYRFHHLHRVVSNLGVFDFGGPGHTLRALSLHPGVTPDEVADNTSFEIAGLDTAETTRCPNEEELRIIRTVLDPNGIRDREVAS